MRYCGPECQRESWAVHKKVCGFEPDWACRVRRFTNDPKVRQTLLVESARFMARNGQTALGKYAVELKFAKDGPPFEVESMALLPIDAIDDGTATFERDRKCSVMLVVASKCDTSAVVTALGLGDTPAEAASAFSRLASSYQ
jgi:hypothetical protein